jgi:DNA mismatch repair protein MLH1
MTKLYLVDVPLLSEEIIYQTVIRSFSKLPKISLSPPIELRLLLHLGPQKYVSFVSSDVKTPLGDVSKEANEMIDFLLEKREMLSEYFSIDISDSGSLMALPLPLPPLPPLIENIFRFLSRLLQETDWTREEECLRDISRSIATLYLIPSSTSLDSLHSLSSSSPLLTTSRSLLPISSEEGQPEQFSLRWIIEHSVFPAARSFVPPQRLAIQGVVCELACLENLYKIFERC